jgi:hypothetical protein
MIDQFEIAQSIQAQTAKLYPTSPPGPDAAPGPIKVGFHFDPRNGHTLNLAVETLEAADLEALRHGGPELRLYGPSLAAFGVAVRFALGGHVTPWFVASYAWRSDSDRRQPIYIDPRASHLLPDAACDMSVSLVINGFRVAQRDLVLERHFAMRLNARILGPPTRRQLPSS